MYSVLNTVFHIKGVERCWKVKQPGHRLGNLSHSGVAIKIIADNMLKIEANMVFIFTKNNFTSTHLQIRLGGLQWRSAC